MSGTTRRYQEGGTGAKKVQRNGAPSTKSPPKDAPEWTVDAGIVISLS